MNNKLKNITIIDCTIRDGGLLNNWEFDDELVKATYLAAFKAGVDYFEIGYKAPESVKGRGKYGYCRDAEIAALMEYSDQTKLTFMIDSNKYDNTLNIPDRGNKTPFKAVRVATYAEDIKAAVALCEKFSSKGYDTFLNLMTFSVFQKEHLDVLKKWKNKKCLKGVYFADSFGSYMPSDITKYTKILFKLGFKNVGYHGHNSLQMAFANTLQSIYDGADHVDATVFGMGRGSGNLPMEILLSYLFKSGFGKYNVVPYLDIIERFYLDLFKTRPWGYSLKSLLGGMKNLHPYYIDELMKLKTYTIEEMWNALECIKDNCPTTYAGGKLTNALEKRFYVPTTEQAETVVRELGSQIKIFPSDDAIKIKILDILNKHKDRKFLIIANGASITANKDKIDRYIKEHAPVTIGCNYLGGKFSPDYQIFVSKKRFLKYAHSISNKTTLIAPGFFGKSIIEQNFAGKTALIDIVSTNDLEENPIDGITQKSVYLNVAIAAMLTAYQMGAKEIMAVGMDGYTDKGSKEVQYFYNENDVPDDKLTASFRYEALDKELVRINKFLLSKGIPFYIITPTSHSMYHKNII